MVDVRCKGSKQLNETCRRNAGSAFDKCEVYLEPILCKNPNLYPWLFHKQNLQSYHIQTKKPFKYERLFSTHSCTRNDDLFWWYEEQYTAICNVLLFMTRLGTNNWPNDSRWKQKTRQRRKSWLSTMLSQEVQLSHPTHIHSSHLIMRSFSGFKKTERWHHELATMCTHVSTDIQV